jgi:hypothetical protein
MTLEDILWICFRQNYHADHSNAAIHCNVVRFSPITFRLAEYIWETFPLYQANDLLREVFYDRNQYEEDRGR